MSRVLVTGGAGTIGAAVVRRLLADPAWEVRVADQREAPDWIRQSCEVATVDLRDARAAAEAAAGCSHVIHLAAIVGGIGNFHKLPYTLLEMNTGLLNGVFPRALDTGVERVGDESASRGSSTAFSAAPSTAASSGWCTSRRRWSSSGRPSSPPPRSTSRTRPSLSR